MTREDVIRAIVERDVRNLTLAADAVSRDLLAAACDHFGTWETALRYAGISRRRLRYAGHGCDDVLHEIRRLCQNGYSLQAERNRRRDPALVDAARRYYGGWKRALRAAGIDLGNAGLRSKPRRLRKQKVLAELQHRYREGKSLLWNDVCLEDRNLATAAKGAFASWWRALAAAGVGPDAPPKRGRRPQWDRQLVVEAIRARHQEGKPLTVAATRRDDSSLVSAGRRYFGNWHDALQAAGLQPEKRRAKEAGK